MAPIRVLNYIILNPHEIVKSEMRKARNEKPGCSSQKHIKEAGIVVYQNSVN